MKFSTFFLLLIVGLVAFAQAAPGDKPAPAKGKPKPKPKPKKHHEVVTSAPTFAPVDNEAVLSSDADYPSFAETEGTTERATKMGLVAVLCGVAVACVVAIVAVVRAPTHTHMPLPDTSENLA